MAPPSGRVPREQLMERRKQQSKCRNALATVAAIASLCATSAAFGDDNLDGLLLAADWSQTATERFTRLSESRTLEQLQDAAWRSPAAAARVSALELPEPKTPLQSFVEKCAELDAIPFLELSADDDHQVFIGVNFDGVLGVHALL